MQPRPPASTLFPYTTLFRSARVDAGTCQPANFNSDGQVVVSGDSAGVEQGMRLLKEAGAKKVIPLRSEEHTSELQSRLHLVCRLLLEKKKMSRGHQSTAAPG